VDLGGRSVNAVVSMVSTERLAATAQWRRRVLRISSLCEIGFGSLWVSNALRAHFPAAGPIVLLIGAAGLAVSIRTTRGTAPRPSGPDARVLERKVTIASVLQIVASVALPVALVAIDRNELIVPVIIVTVGALFVWLNRLLHVPRLGALGGALVVIPIAALAALSGSARSTLMLLAAGTLMVANGSAGIRGFARPTYCEGSQRKRRIATTRPATPHTAITAR
jgi:hypothetical protein